MTRSGAWTRPVKSWPPSTLESTCDRAWGDHVTSMRSRGIRSRSRAQCPRSRLSRLSGAHLRLRERRDCAWHSRESPASRWRHRFGRRGRDSAGFHGDSAWTYGVGQISGDAAALLRDTEQALLLAVEAAMSGSRLGAIGHAVESHARRLGRGVVRNYGGHGIGGKCTKILTCRMWAAQIAALSSDRSDTGHRANADPWQRGHKDAGGWLDCRHGRWLA